MSNAVFIVHSNPAVGYEVEFGPWYDRHLAEVLGVPGFIRARRYVRSDAQYKPLSDFAHVAIYEFDGDPIEAMAALGQAMSDGTVAGSVVIDSVFYGTTYEAAGDWVTADH